MNGISIEMLRSLVSYDPMTGVLTWLPRDGSNTFNSKFAGKVALGCVNRRGYRGGKLMGMDAKAHRVAFALAHGYWPVGEVDHINGDGADNRLANLREVTPSQNCRNQKRPSHNTSGVLGVWFDKSRQRWRAEARHAGVNHKLGSFSTKEEAMMARSIANDRFGYHENHGRVGTNG
jgi:hypothetical protein